MTEPIDGRQLMRELQPRQARASAALETALGIKEQQYPSLTEYIDHFRLSKRLEIYGPTPELRFIESDQTDPAGQFRLRIASDIAYFERAKTAIWATSTQLLKIEPTAYRFTLGDTALAGLDLVFNEASAGIVKISASDNDAVIRLHGGAYQANQYMPVVEVSSTLFSVKTGNSGASALLTRLTVSTNVTTAIATWSNTHHTGFIADGVGGRGNQNMAISGNDTVTDATARRITLSVLDPATDTKHIVANAVPDAAVPKFTMAAPDDAPSTTELDADHITFSYTKATDTLNVHVNEGGVIKTLAIGVLV